MAAWIAFFILTYAALGLSFALYFVSRGLTRLDASTAGSGLAFRLLLIPGSVALWPLLTIRLIATPTKGPHA
ncbi:MAG: hypothetical protein ACKVS9_00285 [Phycisphaerae bacterium]